MLDTALLTFALTMVASPPQQPAKAPRKPARKIAVENCELADWVEVK